jgi:hypothetical protein
VPSTVGGSALIAGDWAATLGVMDLVAPFATREAIAAGMTRAQLRSRQWRAPFSGVRIPRDADPGFLQRCASLATVLPSNAVFSGLTAARLLGWWLPHDADSNCLEVTVRPEQVVSRVGVRCTRSPVDPRDVIEHQGLPITAAVRTLRDLAAKWPLVDMVVMGDAALRSGDCTAAQLAEFAQVARGDRGIRTFRRMSQLVDGRSQSPMETGMRLSIVLSRLPPPTPQAIIRDAAGGWLAQVDLLGADGKSVFEYDGSEHFEEMRHASDVARWRILRGAGLEVYPYTGREFFLRPHQIPSDYRDALGLPPTAGNIDAWVREFRRSSFGGRYRGRG